jgi:hypothetical protein
MAMLPLDETPFAPPFATIPSSQTPRAPIVSARSPRSRWSAATFHPDAPLRIGVIANPRARALRVGIDERGGIDTTQNGVLRALTGAAASSSSVVFRATPDLAALDNTLDEFASRGVNVIAIAGGDGTLHHGLNALARSAAPEHAAPSDPLRPWPGSLLVLRGGTLNIVARSLGESASLSPDLALGRLLARAASSTNPKLGELATITKRVPVLSIRHERLQQRLGFLFGSEMVKNALEMYDLFGGGYGGLSRFLYEVGKGYAFRGALWQKERWRLDPPSSAVRALDETTGETAGSTKYAAAIACAVDLVINGGVHAVRRPTHARGFHTRMITETKIPALLKMIPSLMRAGTPAGVLDVPETTSLRLAGSYTLDGECFGPSSKERTPEEAGTLEVRADDSVAFLTV